MMAWAHAKGKGKGFGKGKKGKTPGSKADPNADMKGKPGPHGEPPESGRWSYESKGTGAGKKWKWKKILTDEEKEARKAKKEIDAITAELNATIEASNRLATEVPQ